MRQALTGAARLERLKVQLGLHLLLEDGLQAPLDASKPHFKANLDSTWLSKPASKRNLAVQVGLRTAQLPSKSPANWLRASILSRSAVQKPCQVIASADFLVLCPSTALPFSKNARPTRNLGKISFYDFFAVPRLRARF